MNQEQSTLIRIDDIPVDRGLEYDQELPLEPLNARMNEGEENDIIFTSAPKMSIKINRTAGGAELIGKVTSSFTQPCGRCTDELERPVEVEMKYMLKPTIEGHNGSEDGEPGVIYFDSDHLDIENIIQETLILSMSAYWLPPKDDDGKCTVCNKIFEEHEETSKKKGVNFGELLKKAGIGDN